jgi:ankyrin repeat protein
MKLSSQEQGVPICSVLLLMGTMHAVVALHLQNESIGSLDVNVSDKDKRSAIFAAAYFGHESIVRKFLECERVDVNAANDLGDTPLMMAGYRGHASVAAALIEYERVDLDAGSNYQITAIMKAGNYGHDTIAHLLISLQRQGQFFPHITLDILYTAWLMMLPLYPLNK